MCGVLLPINKEDFLKNGNFKDSLLAKMREKTVIRNGLLVSILFRTGNRDYRHKRFFFLLLATVTVRMLTTWVPTGTTGLRLRTTTTPTT